MKIDHITINGQPFEPTWDGIAAARENVQLVKHHEELGERSVADRMLGRPEPDFPRASPDCVRVYFMAEASAYVNLTSNTFEVLDLDVTELDPAQLTVWDELSEADDQRARRIVASLGHTASE